MTAPDPTPSQLASALDWLTDCFGDEIPDDVTWNEVYFATCRYYDGGWAGFAADLGAVA